MILKRCAAPRNGGSARGNVRYILGYELGPKGDRERSNESYHALMAEAAEREDLGVGTIWKPVVGEGIRPSAVLALNVTSLGTADLEMQATAQANKRTKSATHHDVLSFGHDPNITDEQALEAARRVYAHQSVGMGDAQMVMAVHRDSGSVHVHVARSSVNPLTLRAYDQHQINTRLDRAARHVEMEMGLSHDRGLAVVYRNRDGIEDVRDSTKEERRAWARESRGERLTELERRRYADVEHREGTFHRYADATVEPRFRELLRAARDTQEQPQAIDVINRAARYGTRIEVDGEGVQARVSLRDVSTLAFTTRQREEMARLVASLKNANASEREARVAEMRTNQREQLANEIERLSREGERAELSERMHDELREAFDDFEILRDAERAEDAFAAALDHDPGIVTRALTQQQSTFTREDIDRHLVDRLTDAGEVERLQEKIYDEDDTLVLLSPDTADGVWSTTEMVAIEERVAQDARALANRSDSRFDTQTRAEAIAAMERERSTEHRQFVVSSEQREALSHQGSLSAVKGRPGVGKTTVMEAIRRDAEANGRGIVGITTSQAAAERLQTEAGFRSVNSAYALLSEKRGHDLIIPVNGVVVLDEAGMIDSRTMKALLETARERNATVIAIADPRQIPPVGAGGAWHILEREARRAGTYSEMNEIRRQENVWHRNAVNLVSDAIEARDEATFERAITILEQHDALAYVANKDEALLEIVRWYEAECANSDDVLLVATTRDDVRYLNEQIRREEGREGNGTRYVTDGGIRQFAKDDRFIFGENSTRLGVVNGDTGTVLSAGKNMITVRLDRTGQSVSMDARRYTSFDYGYATTVHRAQGASVRSIGGVLDGSVSAETFNVLTSRSKQSLRVLAVRSSFADGRDLAEHLRDRISDKGTTQDITAEIGSRGGPDTHYARNVNAQRQSARNPARQEYDAEWTVRRNARDVELRAITERYRTLRVEAGRDSDELASLRSLQRREEAAVVASHTPEDYGVWLHRHRERQEAVEGRLGEVSQRREGQRHRSERLRGRSGSERTTHEVREHSGRDRDDGGGRSR